MTNQIFIADETDADTRIDTFLSGVLEDISRTKIQEYIKSHLVCINENFCKPSTIIHIEDKIVCNFDNISDKVIEPENINIDIVYEDENIAIVNKPSGMLTHPTSKERNNTLVNALIYKYGENLSDINGLYRRGIVHRLDRNTSGLLIIAKNNSAHEKISEMIRNRQIEKHYRAVVKGIISEDMIIDTPIGRNKTQPNKMCTTPDGKPSLTEIKVLKQYKDATFIDINLKTGRTHQIRVHLSSINHPVYNDTLYGFGKMKIKTEEQVLQSFKLKFTNPFNHNIIDIEIPPDDKITKVLNYLDNK